MEWHIFTDASEKAYGAVAYLRVTTPNGDIVCYVLTSKSRVAPLKTQSIPRLELFGALLGARLGSYVKSACRVDASATCYWTDSAIVLSWLKKEPAVLSSFIGTRISEIQELTRGQSWHHVRGDCNPADILSRGGTAVQLKESPTWWHGPDWLSKPHDQWPDHTTPRLSSKESELIIKEFKKSHRSSANPAQGDNTPFASANVFLASANSISSGLLPEGNPAYDQLSIRDNQGRFQPLTSRCVTLFGLLRVTALVQRFIANTRRSIAESRSRPTAIPDPLLKVECVSTHERNDALQNWLRIAQRCSFAKEIAACKQRLTIPTNSKLRTLAPKWNANTGLLVLTGRLDNALISDHERHPIILPADHALVTLMIQNVHVSQTMHGGPQACIAFLRQRYWILNLRTSVRRFIGQRCTVCIRYRRSTAEQLMGQLPAARVTPAQPFARVGVDFAGPFSLRKSASTAMQLRTAAKPTSTYREPHTTIKGWIVVFVCLVTRAVHLDVVRGLSVEHFLDALVRFISRRGMCAEIWSDNGTTFVGTDNEIQRVLKEWGDRLPIAEMANLGITWKFITPAAPHRGGIWEAGVKSMKHHLYRVMGRRILTADQLYTLVTQIEACMNARPLFRQSDDPTDLNPITPAHLAIGRSTFQLPLIEDVSQVVEDRLTIWGLRQKMLQQFWSSWKEDYLTSLQTRNKWFDIEANLSPGDIVVLAKENTPPSAWPLGKVITTTAGEDGLVREAKIIIPAIRNGRHTTTTLDRPIQKLCVLLKDNQLAHSTQPVNAQLAHEAH